MEISPELSFEEVIQNNNKFSRRDALTLFSTSIVEAALLVACAGPKSSAQPAPASGNRIVKVEEPTASPAVVIRPSIVPSQNPILAESIDPAIEKMLFLNYNHVLKDPTGAFGVKEYSNQPRGSGEFTHFVKGGIFSTQNNILRARVPFSPDHPYIAFQSLMTFTSNDSALLLSVTLSDLVSRITMDDKKLLICNFDVTKPAILTITYHSFKLDQNQRFNDQTYDLKAPACQ